MDPAFWENAASMEENLINKTKDSIVDDDLDEIKMEEEDVEQELIDDKKKLQELKK